MDLREGRLSFEMMERVPHDGVDRAVRKWDGFGGCVDDADRRQPLAQNGPHVRRRLHGDRLRAEAREQLRQLAGPCGEIDHHRAVVKGAAFGSPCDGLRRVARPEVVVVERVDDLEAEAGQRCAS